MSSTTTSDSYGETWVSVDVALSRLLSERDYFESRLGSHQEHGGNAITDPEFENLVEEIPQPERIKLVPGQESVEERDDLSSSLHKRIIDLDAFQTEMLRWTVSPSDAESGSKEDLIEGNYAWYQWYTKQESTAIF